MIANALSVCDLEAAVPADRSVLEDLLGPPRGGWRLDRPYGAGGVSTCSMVALGLLRRLGVDSPEILAPYQPGTGLRAARRFAGSLRPRSAWIRPQSGLRPMPGDVIDYRPIPGGRDQSNHTEIVIGWTQRGGADLVVAIAGGQVGAAGLQAIHRVSRLWTERDGHTYSGSREVDGWICLDLLPFAGEVTAPEGWDA